MLATYRPTGCMLATYRSYEACWTAFGAVSWQPTGPMRLGEPPLGLYVGNLQAVCWQPTGPMRLGEPHLGLYVGNLQAVCWQPTGPMRPVGRPWGLYVGNLQAVCWQPTGPMSPVGRPLGLYVGNLHAAVTCCMLATYRSYEACWTAFGAVGNLQVL